ncbi:MAG: FtsX-like permease family protein [Bacteroidales bacterium]|nr:FtsX-like permease family protein [Bacteroidales bacterium]
MKLSLYIAKRYLFAKKSHNVINIISAISATGMAIGTAALIIILSVYNGFDNIIRQNLSESDPDYLILPSEGKTFNGSDLPLSALAETFSISGIIEESVFITYGGNQGFAKARGVESSDSSSLWLGDIARAKFGPGIASELGINPRFVENAFLYFPDRNAKFSPVNPEAALNNVRVKPVDIFTSTTEFDNDLVIVPIELMRTLLGYGEDEFTAVELRGRAGAALDLGNDFVILDRYHQHPEIYKMMKYEKAAIYLILIFIVIIISLNIFGSLSMLIIEKQGDIDTLHALGADDKLIRKIFALEGWLISLLGMVSGLVVGILTVVIQSRFGIVKLPGNYLVDAYPVALQWTDVLLTAAAVTAIGFIISLSAGRNRLLSR